MFFSAVTAAVVGLAAFASAQDDLPFNPINSPNRFEVWEAGSTQTITWTVQPEEFADGTVTMTLIGGDTQNTQVEQLTIAESVPNGAGEFVWELPSDIGGLNFYGISMVLDSDSSFQQFSNPFNITAPEGGDEDEDSTTTVTEGSATQTVSLSPDPTFSTAPVSTTTSTSVVAPSSSLPYYSSSAGSETDAPAPTDAPTDSEEDLPSVTTSSSLDAAPKATAGAVALLGVAAIAAML